MRQLNLSSPACGLALHAPSATCRHPGNQRVHGNEADREEQIGEIEFSTGDHAQDGSEHSFSSNA
jgi:hypothetical protein